MNEQHEIEIKITPRMKRIIVSLSMLVIGVIYIFFILNLMNLAYTLTVGHWGWGDPVAGPLLTFFGMLIVTAGACLYFFGDRD